MSRPAQGNVGTLCCLQTGHRSGHLEGATVYPPCLEVLGCILPGQEGIEDMSPQLDYAGHVLAKGGHLLSGEEEQKV